MWTSGPRFGRCCQPLWLASASGIYGTKPVIKWNRKGFGTCSWKTNPSHFKTGNLVPWNALFFHDVVLMIKIHNLLFEHHILIHIHSFYQPFCYMCPGRARLSLWKKLEMNPARIQIGCQKVFSSHISACKGIHEELLPDHAWKTTPSIRQIAWKGRWNSPCSAMPYVFRVAASFSNRRYIKFLAFRQLINQDLPARLRRLPGFRRWIVENVLDFVSPSRSGSCAATTTPSFFPSLFSRKTWKLLDLSFFAWPRKKRMNSQHRTLRRLQNLAPTQWRIWPSITILFPPGGWCKFHPLQTPARPGRWSHSVPLIRELSPTHCANHS